MHIHTLTHTHTHTHYHTHRPMAPSSYRRIGFSLTDRSTQTERSDILELKSVNSSIGILLQDVAKLRKDLNFAQSVMKADYESRLNDRATAL